MSYIFSHFEAWLINEEFFSPYFVNPFSINDMLLNIRYFFIREIIYFSVKNEKSWLYTVSVLFRLPMQKLVQKDILQMRREGCNHRITIDNILNRILKFFYILLLDSQGINDLLNLMTTLSMTF
jgi:hypothetical protein